MDDSPYRRMAVASAFSPRFEQVLAEAKRMRDRFGAELDLIYVGDRSEEATRRFGEALAAFDLPADSRIHYQQGTPAEAIVAAAIANDVELIVAGALEKEVVLRPFLGNVARHLAREAPCSVMLFTDPEREPKPLARIVFLVPEYSEHARRALRRTLRVAEAEQCENLHAIRIHTSFDQARATLRANAKRSDELRGDGSFEEEERALEEFVEGTGATTVPIETRCIRGNTGFSASDFVQDIKADLLVVPVEAKGDSSGLPPNMAWVTEVIPCNLWIIR
jgi:nucleotide-binding universal stress UspA family protein